MITINKQTFNKMIDETNKVSKFALDTYRDKLPNFMVNGMNPSEFICHLVYMGFNAGYEFAERSGDTK